jgi:TRAP transporter TAXI family solute receptor
MMAWLGRFVAATAMLGLAASASAQIVGIGTNPQGTLAYSSAATLAKAAGDVAKLQVRVQPSAGPSIVTLLSIHEFAGRGGEAKKPHNLRLAIILFPLRGGILVKKDSAIRTIADLRGKRVTGEFATQINSLWMAEATLASAGLTYADVQNVPVPHVVRGIEDFAAGRADAAFFSLGAAKVAEVNAQVGGVRFISVENNARTAAAFEKHAPGSYVSQVTPSPALVGIPEPTNILATDLTMIVGTKTPDEVVYKLVKSAYEKRAEMADAFPPFKEMTAMAKKAAFEFHPGAIKAYTEIGTWPPKE